MSFLTTQRVPFMHLPNGPEEQSFISPSTYDHFPTVESKYRNLNHAEFLVDLATDILKTLGIAGTGTPVILPTDLGFISPGKNAQHASVMPLSSFISEILRRSRVSYTTFIMALWILKRVHRGLLFQSRQQRTDPLLIASCSRNFSRRMFILSTSIASKYLHDVQPNNKCWANMCGMDIRDMNRYEIMILNILEHQLYFSEDMFNKWTELLFSEENMAKYYQKLDKLNNTPILFMNQTKYLKAFTPVQIVPKNTFGTPSAFQQQAEQQKHLKYQPKYDGIHVPTCVPISPHPHPHHYLPYSVTNQTFSPEIAVRYHFPMKRKRSPMSCFRLDAVDPFFPIVSIE